MPLNDSITELLKSYASGNGVQYHPGEPVLVPGVPDQTGPWLEQKPEGDLDFVLVGTGWWKDRDPYVALSEWRRVLREGGLLAVLVEADLALANLHARTLAREGGLAMENPIPVGNGTFVLTGRRSFTIALRLPITSLTREVGRVKKPEGWQSEFNFSVASVLLGAGQGADAEVFFGKVLALESKNVDALAGLGIALAVQSKWEEAERALAQVGVLDETNEIAKEWLGRCRKNLLRPVPAARSATPTVPVEATARRL